MATQTAQETNEEKKGIWAKETDMIKRDPNDLNDHLTVSIFTYDLIFLQGQHIHLEIIMVVL